MYKNKAIATLTALYTIELCQRICSVQLTMVQYVLAVAFLAWVVYWGGMEVVDKFNRRKQDEL